MVCSKVRPGIFSCFLAWLFVAGLTFSASGLANDDLTEAIEAWLADDDEHAIPALSELASDGNTEARLLLAEIDRRPGALSPYLAGLSRKQRNGLMKAPGGLSGISWLSAEEADDDIFQAFREAGDPKLREEGILRLLDLGEKGPAIGPIMTHFNHRGPAEILKLSGHENFPDELNYLAWLSALLAPEETTGQKSALLDELDDKLAVYDLAALTALPGSRSLFTPARVADLSSQFAAADILRAYAFERGSLTEFFSKPESGRVDEILMSDSRLGPLREICSADCPQSGVNCVRTLYYGVGGWTVLAMLQSPVERLIPASDYLSSKRYLADIRRNAHAVFDNSWGQGAARSGGPVERVTDQCIVSSVTDFVRTGN